MLTVQTHPSYQQGKGGLGCTCWDAHQIAFYMHIKFLPAGLYWLPAPGAYRTLTAGELSVLQR